MLKKELKKFGDEGERAKYIETEQMHKPMCFTPVLVKGLTPEEKEKAQQALCFLNKKSDGTIKAWTVYNNKPTRNG